MVVLNVDLDNTLIYSYKKNTKLGKINVEWYNGHWISYITKKTYKLLLSLKNQMLIVPTSTRSESQYKRINLRAGNIKYALVCNGGVLLENGIRNKEWYNKSQDIIKESIPELKKAASFLEKDLRRKMEIRFIDNLFIFTKCDRAEEVVQELKGFINTSQAGVFNNGEKVYVLPTGLDKGMAVKRFREYINADMVIAAGDSSFDISMLEAADKKLAPYGFARKYKINFKPEEAAEDMWFSEFILEYCINLASNYYK